MLWYFEDWYLAIINDWQNYKMASKKPFGHFKGVLNGKFVWNKKYNFTVYYRCNFNFIGLFHTFSYTLNLNHYIRAGIYYLRFESVYCIIRDFIQSMGKYIFLVKGCTYCFPIINHNPQCYKSWLTVNKILHNDICQKLYQNKVIKNWCTITSLSNITNKSIRNTP